MTRLFSSKSSLLEGLLQEVQAAVRETWLAAAADGADPATKLHSGIDLFLSSLRSFPQERRILQRCLAEGDEEAAGPLRAFFLDAEALLARTIAEGQQSGVFRRSLDPRVGAWQLLHTALGYLLAQTLDAPLFAESDYLPRAIDCLLHGLLKTDV
jgi:AcrR family transcriptional regulator